MLTWVAGWGRGVQTTGPGTGWTAGTRLTPAAAAEQNSYRWLVYRCTVQWARDRMNSWDQADSSSSYKIEQLHNSYTTRNLSQLISVTLNDKGLSAPPADPLQKTDKKAPISGDPPTCNFIYRSDESENNVKHYVSPADSSGCQAWDPGLFVS